MRSLLLQIAAVTTINLKSLPQRLWLSLSTVTAVALVVMVLLSFLAMANGFQRTIEGSGAPDVAVLLRAGAQSEINSAVTQDQARLIEEAPGIAKSADGRPLVSSELYIIVDGVKRTTQTKANMPLRGIGSQGLALRRGISPSGPDQRVDPRPRRHGHAGFQILHRRAATREGVRHPGPPYPRRHRGAVSRSGRVPPLAGQVLSPSSRRRELGATSFCGCAACSTPLACIMVATG
jgi:hypothetical protein